MSIAMPIVMGLLMVLFGAELFTNAIEWLGHKLQLGQGAVGSILAALGTALPETAVPITAILMGNGTREAQEVGVGGILGAPFLLVTLGSLVIALSLAFSRKKREPLLAVPRKSFERDMSYFLVAFTITVLVGCIHNSLLHRIAPVLLIGIYLSFIVVTIREGRMHRSESPLAPLYIQRKSEEPNSLGVLLQLVIALLLIIGGAKFLTLGVKELATALSFPTFVMSALLIPIATELPETLNSVVWIRQRKDALALGNITGAMVFQSTLVPALGISLTPWDFDGSALLTGALTLAAATLIYGIYRIQNQLTQSTLFSASFLYWVLPLYTFVTKYGFRHLYWIAIFLVGTPLLMLVWGGMRRQTT